MAPSSGDRDVGDAAGHDRAQADVVAVEADVERPDRHGRADAGDAGHRPASRSAIHTPPRCRPTQHDAVGAVVALDDLVGDAGERPAHVVGVSTSVWTRKTPPAGGASPGSVGSRHPSAPPPFRPHGTRFTAAATIAGAARRRGGSGAGWPRRVGLRPDAMADSMPLTKRPESSVENRLASSTASSMHDGDRHVGPVEQLEGGDAQHGAVDHRHALQRPAPGVGGDQLVELGRWSSTPSTSSVGQPSGCEHLRRPAPRAAGTLLRLGLVQQSSARSRASERTSSAQLVVRARSDPRDVVAAAGVDLDPVADVDEQRDLDAPCRSPAWPACGRPTPGRPACPARSRRWSARPTPGSRRCTISPSKMARLAIGLLDQVVGGVAEGRPGHVELVVRRRCP